MKKLFLLALLLVQNILINAQDINTLFSQFGTAYGEANISGMDRAANTIKKIAADNYAGWAYGAFVALLQNNLPKARQQIKVANAIFPVDPGSYSISSYLYFIDGNVTKAQEMMDYAFQMDPSNAQLQNLLGDIRMIASKTGKSMLGLERITQNSFNKYMGKTNPMQQYQNNFSFWQKGQNSPSESEFRNGFKKFSPVNKEILAYATMTKAFYFYNNRRFEEAKTLFQDYLNDPVVKNSDRLQYSKAQAYEFLARFDQTDYRFEQAYDKTQKALQLANIIPVPHNLKADILARKLQVLPYLKKNSELKSTAEALASVAKHLNYTYRLIEAENALGSFYLNSALTSDRSKAFSYLQSAHYKAKSFGDENLLNSVNSNYAIALWQQGRKSEALKITKETMDKAIANKDYSGAQLIGNNLGFMSFTQKDYANAAKAFEKSIAITERYRKLLNANQRLVMMNEHSSAYSGLIMSYQKTNQAENLFNIQDLNRSRLLREKLDKNTQATTLANTQSKLKPDEVLLYYSLAGPGEMIVNVITNSSIKAFYNFPIDNWLLIKKKLTNKVIKKPNQINNFLVGLDQDVIDGKVVQYASKNQAFNKDDFDAYVRITQDLFKSNEEHLEPYLIDALKEWYKFLVQPIEAEIKGKRTLIISTENALNYLPFEAFINSQGQYLIENFNVKYIPSATVWTSLSNRNYSDDRKQLIAFGGATYQNPKAVNNEMRAINSVFEIQDKLDQKIKNKQSNLSKELKALGFSGANYLAGTLKEVKTLEKIVPSSKVFTADQMKESDIKRLNQQGELSQYRYVHIATHGFASDTFPQLSGVMMTQPNSGDGNEDTFLLAHEIAALNLNADLAVLSACETALGKIYGGEGVNGLNSALLIAGANNTLLSLWPVNDAGTVIFTTLVYQNMVEQQQSVEDAVCNAKRAMLKNSKNPFFAKPKIWAPFVLSGR